MRIKQLGVVVMVFALASIAVLLNTARIHAEEPDTPGAFEARFEENVKLHGWTQVRSPWTVIDNPESEHYGAVTNSVQLAALYCDVYDLPENFKISFEMYPTTTADGLFIVFNVADTSAEYANQHHWHFRWYYDSHNYHLRYWKAYNVYDEYAKGSGAFRLQPNQYTKVTLIVKDGLLVFRAGDGEVVIGHLPTIVRGEDGEPEWRYEGNLPIVPGYPGTKFGIMKFGNNPVYIKNLRVEPVLDDDLDIPKPPQPERTEYVFPKVNDDSSVYEILRGDFHMHTRNSDGHLLVEERLLEAWEYGYDVVAITEHGNYPTWKNSYDQGIALADVLNLVVIRGLETGLSTGNPPQALRGEHLVALDFSENYHDIAQDEHNWSETPDGSTIFYQEQWTKLANAGAYMIYAHPHMGFREQDQWAYNQGFLHGIEVYNHHVSVGSWGTSYSHGTYWYPSFFDLAVENNLAVFANTDSHRPRSDYQGEQPATLVLAKERTSEGVMEALRNGRTVAYFNNMLCACEELLRLLADSFVTIQMTNNMETDVLEVENHSSLQLKLWIEELKKEVTLNPHETVTVESGKTLGNELSLVWTNMWISSKLNLTTTYSLKK